MRKKKIFYVLPLLCLTGLLALWGCGSEPESSGNKDTEEAAETEGLGEFSIEDTDGNTYTQEMFAGYDLTMVNVFATWCTPCIREIPDLEKLKNAMESQRVNVVGIVLDAVTDSGEVDETAVENARLLADECGVTYPFLIPDKGRLNGRLSGISAVPETFFVDREGNIVGETYTGSRGLEDWKAIVEQELEGAGK